MAVGIKKYNPGFLSDEEVVESFSVRVHQFESLVDSLRSSRGSSNIHSLVIGPRGSGKTHLLLRVTAEIRRDTSLSGFYPIRFAEESYEVSSIGEFWLECLGHLSEQAPEYERANLRMSYNDLRTRRDDRELANRCLGAILDFADRHDKRIVLLVENLNMLFADMDDRDAGWRLRHTLQTEPRIVLLGSATSRFDEIDHPDHALYDLFKVITLHPLETRECLTLWQTVTGQPSTTTSIRPLEILTGGNPRLLTIIARFGAGRSFRELKGSLLDLVDDHTEYFKSHLESLPALERRVYLALARLWKPATAREAADQARIDINRCSALLTRLVGRGAVTVVGGTARRRQYYLTERLYNIYYLLRRDSGSSQAVEALVDFMVCLYSPAELWDAVAEMYRGTSLAKVDVQEPVAQVLIERAQLLADIGHDTEAIAIFEQVAARLRESREERHRSQAAVALLNKVLRLNMADRYDETVVACDELLASFGTDRDPIVVAISGMAMSSKGRAWAQLGNAPEAVRAFDQALVCFNEVMTPVFDQLVAETTYRKALALIQNEHLNEAVAAFDAVVERSLTSGKPSLVSLATNALLSKGSALLVQGRNLSEHEFSLLLDCISREGGIRPGSIQVLTLFAVRLGLDRALELLQESSAARLLLPLVTAIQREIGQEPLVAREVEEVAKDVRRDLIKVIPGYRLGELALIREITTGMLQEDVTLNQSRLDRAEMAVAALNDYLKERLPGYQRVEKQGSYALGTIIRPVDDNGEFDAEILIVMSPNSGWEPKDYLGAISKTLSDSKNYNDKIKLKARCVTIDYSGDFHLDIVPMVTVDGTHFICNRVDNKFEQTDGIGFRDWFNEKNRIAGDNLKRVVMLLKYLRDHKNAFSAGSIVMTTLVGNMITAEDEGTEAVRTVGGTLEIVLSRMNDYLQSNPDVPDIKNPALPTESFSKHWDSSKYEIFRSYMQAFLRAVEQTRVEPSGGSAIEILQDPPGFNDQGLIRASVKGPPVGTTQKV